MEIKEIQKLIKFVAGSGAHEVSLETDDFKITIKTSPDATPTDSIQQPQTLPNVVVQSPPAQNPVIEAETSPTVTQADEQDKTDDLMTIKSPMIGTFYRKPSPDKEVFVEVGDTIKEGEVLCVVEAMKLFNEIESEVSGKIVKILLDDSSPVEFDQPLFLIEPV